MVKIIKNGKTMTVARSAYEEIFKPNGWAIANGEVKENIQEENVTPEPIEDNQEDNQEDELTDDDWADAEEEAEDLEGVTKPLSEMNRQELENRAIELGIDISKANSNKQLRELIKNHQ